VELDDYAEDVTLTFEETIVQGSNSTTFNVLRTWTATDPCGNASSGTQRITWIPDTQLECEIDLPDVPACNTHGVEIGSTITGGLGGYEYLWTVDGVDCYIQSGQGTPEITIYVGFSIVNISLVVTDGFGCSTNCSATLDCDDPFEGMLIRPGSDIFHPDAEHSPKHSPFLPADDIHRIDIWPNPVEEYFNLQLYSQHSGEIKLTMVDVMGHEVMEQDLDVVEGENEQRISTSKFVPGSYMVQVQRDDYLEMRMIVIVRD
jgi:hypothetical protein